MAMIRNLCLCKLVGSADLCRIYKLEKFRMDMMHLYRISRDGIGSNSWQRWKSFENILGISRKSFEFR